VGKGNNGGDGLAAARHLHNFGVAVKVVLAGEIHMEEPLAQLESLRKLSVPVLEDPADPGSPGLVIDALLGYSAKGEPRGAVALLIREARRTGAPVLSVDIPSGLEVSTGTWFDPCFKESTCLTLALPKKGMTRDPGIERLLVGDIGIPREAFHRIGVRVPALFGKGPVIEVRSRRLRSQKP
jgi:NAD(P)H-hydrate epimerase